MQRVIESATLTTGDAVGQRAACGRAILLLRLTDRFNARILIGWRGECKTGVEAGRELIRTIAPALTDGVFDAVAAATPGAPA
jgi:hypothetical protein